MMSLIPKDTLISPRMVPARLKFLPFLSVKAQPRNLAFPLPHPTRLVLLSLR